jgi:hypothetical protein
MTKETRTLIDLKDIQGIEIECKKCKAKAMLPIDENLNLGHGCFQCNTVWFTPGVDEVGQSFAVAVKQIEVLVKAIKHLTSTQRSDIHAPIRLHIATTLHE